MGCREYNKADYWLLAAAVGFLITLMLKIFFPEYVLIRGLNFACEAAFVGGAADWFAVTAIFKHPWGVKIPNTAILPQKRDDFAEGAAAFVKEMLNEETVVREIRNKNIMGLIVRQLKETEKRDYMIAKLLDYIREKLSQASRGENVQELADGIREKLLSYPSKYLLKQGLAWLKTDDNGAIALESVVPLLKDKINSSDFKDWLQDNYDNLQKESLASLVSWALERANLLNVKEAAEDTQSELLAMVAEMGIRNSDVQRKVLRLLVERSDEIANDKRLIRSLDEFRVKLIKKIPLEDVLYDVISRLWKNFKEEESRKVISEHAQKALRSHIVEVLLYQLDLLMNLLKNDADLQRDIDKFIKELISEFATGMARPEAEKIVKRVLQNMKDDELNEIVKGKINDELIGIRVNGVVVGFILGSILYAGVQFTKLVL